MRFSALIFAQNSAGIFGVHRSLIFDELLFTPATHHQGCNDIGRRGKLQSGSPDSVVTHDLTQPSCAFRWTPAESDTSPYRSCTPRRLPRSYSSEQHWN